MGKSVDTAEGYPSNGGALLELSNLKTHFFTSRGIVRAVDGVDFEIEYGRSVGLVGESGSGKTMTALSIVRLVPTPGRTVTGQVLYKNKDLLKLSEKDIRNIRGKEISIVFQDPMTYLNPVLKVGEQIGETIELHHDLQRHELESRICEILDDVGLPSPRRLAERYPHQLSGGMRQRVLIAMALSCRPSMLIADEPTTALDVTVQAQILDLIKDLIDRRGVSLLLITHDLGIVADICDEICIMYAGKIVEKGDVYEVFEKPKHPYTVGLLESTLSIDELRRELISIPGRVPNLMNPPSGCRFHPRCSKAMDSCRKEEPTMSKVGSSYVSCFLYE